MARVARPTVVPQDETAEYFFTEGCFILESWNDELDPDVSIARARLGSGEGTKSHLLVSTDERYVILEGRGEVILGGAEPQHVATGDVVFIPAGCSQSIRNTGEADLVFLAICSPRFTAECYREDNS